MRQFAKGLPLVVVVLVVALTACSGPTFNASGSYSGTGSSGGTPFSLTATITATSTANQWDLSITSPSETDTGTCTHAPNGSAGNLTCTFTYTTGGPGTVVFAGTLTNNTWSGSYTDSNGPGGTFTLTRS